MADGALPSSYTTPPNVGTAGSTGGSTLTQGAAMPNISTTQQQATGAPSWYTDYLQNIATTGQNAAQNAQFVGPTAMQNQSYDLAQQNVGNWQPAMNNATGAVNQATNMASPLTAAQPYLNSAANPTYNTVNSYMSPYINDVVGQIGNLAQQNMMQTVAPQTSAGLVGSGQFGSQRGAQALGQTLANYGQQTTAAQTNALNTGYQNAMTQAQNQAALQGQLGQTAGSLQSAGQTNLINAGQVGGQLATATQNLGLGDVNALNTLGTQQQQIAQAQQLFPMQMAQQQAGLLQGAQIPTSASTTYTGPIPNAYQASPLQQITSLGAGAMGLLTPNAQGVVPAQSALSTLSQLLGISGPGTTTTVPQDASQIAANNAVNPLYDTSQSTASGVGSDGAYSYSNLPDAFGNQLSQP